MGKLVILDHPLMHQKLSIIRNEETCTKDFHKIVNEIGMLMAYDVSRDLKTKTVAVKTPMGIAECKKLATDVVIVPILRAGLGMMEGIMALIPTAKVGFIGLYRDEETLKPHKYYAKFPENLEKATVMLLDPMLATGGSVCAAVKILKEAGARKISYVGIVAAPEGVQAVQKEHPDVDIYLAALDEKLNDIGYIVPGLGDCGDRLFGTK